MSVNNLGDILGVIPLKKERETGDSPRKRKQKEEQDKDQEREDEKQDKKDGRIDIRV